MVKALIVFLLATLTGGLYAQTQSDLRAEVSEFVHQQSLVRSVSSVSLSKDGKWLAWSADGPQAGAHSVYVNSVEHPGRSTRFSASAVPENPYEYSPVWSPDGTQIAFLSDYKALEGQQQVYVTSLSHLNSAKQMTLLNGAVSHLLWSPDGSSLSILYVEKATREPSPMAPTRKAVGIIDSLAKKDIQRLAVINPKTGHMKQISPPDLYVYEYDWSPDSRQVTYTAAQPPGDDNWYVARLYIQSTTQASPRLIYTPKLQIAVPRWSPDGARIAFIEGLMSDQGGTGGEIFTVLAVHPSTPQNHTPGRRTTPGWLAWQSSENLLFTEFAGGETRVNTLHVATNETSQVWRTEHSLQATEEEMSLSYTPAGLGCFAFYDMSWGSLPEVWYGKPGKFKQLSSLNSKSKFELPQARSVEWQSGHYKVQGWLLFPQHYNASRKYPLLVTVHGGPAWIARPTWSAPDFNTTFYTRQGYFVFFPNARGSYGQGEQFTLEARRDWGFGDLKDITAGIDTLLKEYPIDATRTGILGWSYGGSMAMFAVTQSNRFKAAVAGAGAADWVSYYGQNSIDQWIKPWFGASPYEDPEAYRKCSSMTYIAHAHTPTLVLVGEYDGEAPPAQSMQFWHALKELKTPAQLVIYEGEGHGFEKPEDQIDVTTRTLMWFNKYLGSN